MLVSPTIACSNCLPINYSLKIGAAAAIALVMPEVAEKFDGVSVRVSVINVSLVDFTFNASCNTSLEETKEILIANAEEINAVMQINSSPLVSLTLITTQLHL